MIKAAILAEADRRAEDNAPLTSALGVIMLSGMVAIERMEKLSGKDLNHIYHTHFPMPDSEWELTLKRKSPA